ncbi:cell envelope integrity protein CreD [Croceicoccus naphthovorans]|uniref:Colicin resistance protein n=1 Tax=Croceicoccus naphthovorans TaxID=1348774 RepID=A0A0G3XIM3_9SPHN|nr:cell envelope integrity protein CreD [Croceicoccus naphthovorans]AKM10471.1 colicin resistance protein [Croceicoccus naphthovorans]MBB3988644.1 inner membrane protein [Croceicoccus naphthovorans]
MDTEYRRQRSPGIKLLFAVLVAAALAVPLFMVYALVWDRQEQSNTARATITQGWGGAQVVTGPVLVVPYAVNVTETEVVDNKRVDKVRRVTRELFISPLSQQVSTSLDPERRQKSIYESVIYRAQLSGEAQFVMPEEDLKRLDIDADSLMLDRAELHFGVSDPRGMQSASKVVANGEALAARPGGGLESTGRSGFFAPIAWDAATPLSIDWSYELRGSETLSLIPRGGDTKWHVKSAWPHPSFSGSFLPSESEIGDDGFSAEFSVPDLALGQGLVTTEDYTAPFIATGPRAYVEPAMVERSGMGGPSMAASVAMVEPVDLYSRIDRSVKYGFLIIGFTFLAFLMFDIVAGASVAGPEYLLTGAGLVLFFVLLLAFSEVIGFAAAYAVASVAIIGLVTAYSAAVLKSWGRAKFVGALLVGLYALLFVLLSLEAWSLLIGSILLFFALAGVMYATRNVDWQGLGRTAEFEG